MAHGKALSMTMTYQTLAKRAGDLTERMEGVQWGTVAPDALLGCLSQGLGSAGNVCVRAATSMT